MKSSKSILVRAITLLALLAMIADVAAQDDVAHANKPKHHHYKLIDLGTSGGPQSWVPGVGEGPGGAVSNAGTVVGGADTSNSNPNYPNVNPFLGPAGLFGYADPFVFQASEWGDGDLVNLGALPSGANSFANWISANGLIVGASENGVIDPLGYPETHAVVWKDGQIIDLGTLGGSESQAAGANNRGQVTGWSLDAANTHTRAFIWTQDEGLRDLGTLGACCAIAGTINERGQISGESGLCDTCNQDAFLWEDGHMRRIPGFGGPITFHEDLNNRGQVVGQSDLPGGQAWHGFLWEKDVLTDLPTLGGCCSGARWINDAGDIVGYAYDQNQLPFAVLWKDGQIKKNLGTVDGDACSIAQTVNSESQVVGLSDMKCDGTVLHAFLWEKGGPAVDLNTLVPPGSRLQLTQATSINDRGEIAGEATTSNGDNHGFLLIPCGDGDEACEGNGEATSVATQNHPAPVHQTPTNVNHGTLTPEALAALRARLARRHHIPGLQPPSR